MTVAPLIPIPVRRELARRTAGELEITLYWDPTDDSISVEVHQPAAQETIALLVASERALDAFHHPFAYMTSAA